MKLELKNVSAMLCHRIVETNPDYYFKLMELGHWRSKFAFIPKWVVDERKWVWLRKVWKREFPDYMWSHHEAHYLKPNKYPWFFFQVKYHTINIQENNP